MVACPVCRRRMTPSGPEHRVRLRPRVTVLDVAGRMHDHTPDPVALPWRCPQGHRTIQTAVVECYACRDKPCPP